MAPPVEVGQNNNGEEYQYVISFVDDSSDPNNLVATEQQANISVVQQETSVTHVTENVRVDQNVQLLYESGVDEMDGLVSYSDGTAAIEHIGYRQEVVVQQVRINLRYPFLSKCHPEDCKKHCHYSDKCS